MDNVKMDLKETGYEDMGWIDVAQATSCEHVAQATSCEHGTVVKLCFDKIRFSFHTYSARYCCPISTKIGMCRQILVRI
jgi:hypothetical protein